MTQRDLPGDRIGICQTHNKVLYTSRKAAKRGKDRLHPGEHKSAYRCVVNPGLWHIGRLDPRVIAGVVPKAVAYREEAA